MTHAGMCAPNGNTELHMQHKHFDVLEFYASMIPWMMGVKLFIRIDTHILPWSASRSTIVRMRNGQICIQFLSAF